MRENTYERERGYAERYRDVRFLTAHGPRTHRREVAALATLLRHVRTAPDAWLDVPSGTGRMSEHLPGPAVQVDRDCAMLHACAPTRPRVCASALALPFADRSFAGVLCLRLLQHLDAAQRVLVLRELARVAQVAVLFSYFDAHSLQHWRRQLRRRLGKPRSGRSAVPWAQLCGELAQAGLRPQARVPLLRFVSEQTLVLAVPVSASEQGGWPEGRQTSGHG